MPASPAPTGARLSSVGPHLWPCSCCPLPSLQSPGGPTLLPFKNGVRRQGGKKPLYLTGCIVYVGVVKGRQERAVTRREAEGRGGKRRDENVPSAPHTLH